MPTVRSAIRELQELAEALDPIQVGHMIATLARWDPLYVAVRLAIEIREARDAAEQAERRGIVEASHAISAALDWRRVANQHVTYAELQRRRGGAA